MLNAVNAPVQTIPAAQSVPFAVNRILTGCAVRHEPSSTRFVIMKPGIYRVGVNADIAVTTGETVGEVSLALNQDGETVPGATGAITPAAVEEFGNVAFAALIRVFGCGGTVISVVNTSGISADVENANIIIERMC